MTRVQGVIAGAISPKALASSINLFFSDRRVIIARAGLSWAVAAGAGGIVGGAMAAGAVKSAEELANQGFAQVPQGILESHPKNREVPYGAIATVELKKAWTVCHLRFRYTDGKGDYFEFPRPAYDAARTLLSAIFGPRLTTKP